MTVPLLAQTKAELEQRRASLLRQIEQNRQLLADTEREESATLATLEGIESRIRLQQEVMKTIRAELSLLDVSIARSEDRIHQLTASASDLAKQQASHVRNAYIDKKMENRFVFLLSANSLNEAVDRWRYLDAVSRSRRSTFDKYNARRDSIAAGLEKLRSLREEKQALAEDAVIQEKALSQTRSESKAVLTDLRKNEVRLRSELEKQNRESKRLSDEIKRLVNATVTEASAAPALPNAPELAALTENFTGNKGRLPWPVDRGMITGRFGEQPHPVIKTIKITNNGIDITAPPGEEVKALFNGTVVGKKVIPGFDYMVIVRHGDFYSVYSRLSRTSVEVGDEIKTGRSIGQLANTGGSNAKLHLEIWKGKTQLDPEQWISR